MENVTTPQHGQKPGRSLSMPGLIIVLIGLGMLLDNLGWDWVDKVWFPVALIVIGALLIFRKNSRS